MKSGSCGVKLTIGQSARKLQRTKVVWRREGGTERKEGKGAGRMSFWV